MTVHEFVELWPLWTYLFGFVATIAGKAAKGAYFDEDITDFDDFIWPMVGTSIVWPLTWFYLIGVGGGLYLKGRKQRSIAKATEKKRLEEKHVKYLKEAGLDV